MRGAKPKLQAIEGGKSRLPAPAWLAEDAKEEWRRVAPELRKRRVLTVADLATLEHYCIACGIVRASQRAIAEEGEVIDTAHGRKRNPALSNMLAAMSEARRFAAELGLSPSSRSKAPIAEAADDLTEFDL